MKDFLDLSRTCRIDLRELTKSIRELDKTQSPIEQAPDKQVRSLVDLFGDEVRRLRLTPTKLSEIVGSLLEKLSLPSTHAHLIAAGKRLSERVDAIITGHPAYQNQQHVAEVVMAAFILGKREHLPSIQTAEILVAAAAHDLGHLGENQPAPAAMKAQSYELALPTMREFRWTEPEIDRFRQMLLATEFGDGVAKARADYVSTRRLSPSDTRRLLATQCLILSEADLLFSCFNEDYNEELSKLLSQGRNQPTENLSLKQRLAFLNSVTFISEASKQLNLEDRRKALIVTLESKAAQKS